MLEDRLPLKGTVSQSVPFDYHGLVSFPKEALEIVDVVPFARSTKLFRHQNLVRKLIFFLIHEGPVAVWSKYISAKFDKTISAKAVFLVARHLETKRLFCGFQHSPDQPVYYFLPDSEDFLKVGERNVLLSFNPFLGHRPSAAATAACEDAAARFLPITQSTPRTAKATSPQLVLIGCGDYARTMVMPAFRGYRTWAAVDFNWEVLQSEWLKPFEVRTNDFDVILDLPRTSEPKLAVIASYHSYHARQAAQLLEDPSYSVVIEKPPCVTRDDLEILTRCYDPERIFIGYNRRFIEWNRAIREWIAEAGEPVLGNIIITETQITDAHWYFAPAQGTRVCGNLCHWVDLAVFLVNRAPRQVSIARNPGRRIDAASFSLSFVDGSLFHFTATDLGDGTSGVQEQLLIRSEALDVRVDDYLKMSAWRRGRKRVWHRLHREKGHARMYRAIRSAWQSGGLDETHYSRDHLIWATKAYIAMVDLFQSEQSVRTFEDVDWAIQRTSRSTRIGRDGTG